MSIGRSEYKHYQVRGREGDPIFFTTTCLDFVHALSARKIRNLMAASLIDHCRFYGAELPVFVVMTHHIHFIARIPKGKTPGWLAQRIKSNSAKRILPKLDAETRAKFDQQRGLNNRSFWRDRYRGYVAGEAFWQKVNYIHNNPAVAGLCASPEEYYWSSARLFVRGRWTEESGLDLNGLVEEYVDPKELES